MNDGHKLPKLLCRIYLTDDVINKHLTGVNLYMNTITALLIVSETAYLP